MKNLALMLLFLLSLSNLAHSEERVLLLGDSHSAGSFGDGLRDGLFSLGIAHEGDFYQISVSGSSATQWVYGRLKDLRIDSTVKFPGQPKIHQPGVLKIEYDGLASALKKIRPDRIIISLGTNDLFQYYETLHPGALKRAREDKAAHNRVPASVVPMDPLPPDLEHDPMGRPLDSMRKLFNSGTNCTLVLPPEVSTEIIPKADQDRFFSRLKSEATTDRCKVVDSRQIIDHSEGPLAHSWQDCQITSENSHPLIADRKDHIHFSQNKGEYWGHCVALAVKEDAKGN